MSFEMPENAFTGNDSIVQSFLTKRIYRGPSDELLIIALNGFLRPLFSILHFDRAMVPSGTVLSV